MSRSRNELDNLVVNIELTLASIIQGVALYFLTENARGLLGPGRFIAALYVACALCIIFIFWSRSIIHTLTLIRWPIEFGHNFFYIGCALGEAVLFSRLSQPRAWFTLSAVYAVFVWFLFVYDIRLLSARRRESNNAENSHLYDVVECDQRVNIQWLLPAMAILNGASALLLYRVPQLISSHHGEAWLAAVQLFSFLVYLKYVTRFWRKLAPLIVAARDTR